MKVIKLRDVLGWLFGLFFIIGGIVTIFHTSILKGLLIIVLGLILFPPMCKFVRHKWKIEFSGWLKIVIVVLGIFFISKIPDYGALIRDSRYADSLYHEIGDAEESMYYYQHFDSKHSEKLGLFQKQCTIIPKYLLISRNYRRAKEVKMLWDLLGGRIELEILKTKINDVENQYQRVLQVYKKTEDLMREEHEIDL